MKIFEHKDCVIGMKEYPDKFFDLAIVDPPYGIGVNHNMGRRNGDKPSSYKPAEWDNMPPDEVYFKELFRVSKDQIIWGANHFISKIPFDSSCWLMWDKKFSELVSFAQYELAWTSFDGVCKKYDKDPKDKNRIHPTQKPVKLYEWMLKHYAKPGYKILDTHTGSGSSIVAFEGGGFDYVAFETDIDHYTNTCKRIEQYRSQLKLF